MNKKFKHHLPIRTKLALEIERKYCNIEIKEHALMQLFWESTLSCNLKCRHCGSDCKIDKTNCDMPVGDFLKVLDGIKAYLKSQGEDYHRIFVIITGGEPLMRQDIAECGFEIYKRGFPWGMVTNGYALTPDLFRKLQAAGLHTMTVSLDGLSDDHNWMRGRNDSFERAVRAIKLLIDTHIHSREAFDIGVGPIKFDVVTCVNKNNLKTLHQIKDFLISLGVKEWRLFTVFPSGRAADEPTLHISNEEFVYLMEFIIETRRERKIKASYGCEGFLGKWEGRVRDHFFKCSAGISVASVLSDGSISACPSIREDFVQGNIYKDDFMDVWNNRFELYRNREWAKKGICANCSFFRYCRGNGMHLRTPDGGISRCYLFGG